MKAIRFSSYGDPCEVLTLVDAPPPAVAGDDGVLVRVAAAGLNPADWHLVSGVPYAARLSMGLRPRTDGLGLDLAGVVEEVGPAVTRFSPGDRVLGLVGPVPGEGPSGRMRLGAVAELVAVREEDLVALPDGVSFDEGAGVGVAGTTALRAVREAGEVTTGDRVLVHGASGGVGSFAVQIAAADGAEVTGVCSTPKVDLVRDLGAARVVDYTREDPTTLAQRFDVVIDNVGDIPPHRWRRVLASDGTYVANFGRKQRRVLGPLARLVMVAVLDAVAGQRFRMLPTHTDLAHLEAMAEMLADGRVRTVVGHTVDLVDAPAAMQLIADGHARGKVVVHVQGV